MLLKYKVYPFPMAERVFIIIGGQLRIRVIIKLEFIGILM